MALRTIKKKDLAAACPAVVLGSGLGEGGNARVFAATSEAYGSVAVKFLLNDNTKRYHRFRDEVLVVRGRLKGSQRVLPILEYHLPEVPEGDVPWYVMPRAKRLTDCVAGRSWQDRLPVLIELAEALMELHANSVAHRDIKPENLFELDGTYRFGDFGIAAFPESAGVTSTNEPMGPWGYMAPEMLSNPTTADAYKADVYSLAKTVWATLTEARIPFAGRYSASSNEGLASYKAGATFVSEPLDSLLELCTDSNPVHRPTAEEFAARLREVALLQEDFHRANPLQWQAAESDALRGLGLVSATWEGTVNIARVLSLLSRRHGLNHCFFPSGGGMAIEGAFACEANEMLALRIEASFGIVVVKPLRLILERFANRPDFSYAVLETCDVEPLGVEQRYRDDAKEYVKQVNDFDYINDDSDDDEPRSRGTGAACERYFKGGLFVIAPTRGVYNLIDDYMGTATKLGREKLRMRFEAHFERLTASSAAPSWQVKRVVRLLASDDNANCPFALAYIDDQLLKRLIDADDARMESRKRGGSGHFAYQGVHSLERALEEPSPDKAAALALLRSMSAQQRAEYLALAYIGRGDVDCRALAEMTAENMRTSLEDAYLLEKLGNGYMRRALERFGLEVINRTGK